MPQTGHGLSCFIVVRRFRGDRMGFDERKTPPFLTDAA
jgi:hypothetical protein